MDGKCISQNELALRWLVSDKMANELRFRKLTMPKNARQVTGSYPALRAKRGNPWIASFLAMTESSSW